MNTVACLICRLFDRCDPCSSEPRWLAVGSYQLSASSRDRLCQFVARHCRSVAWAEQATGRRKTAGRILSSEPSVPPYVIHLTALCPGLPGWASTRKENHLDFTEARGSEWQWNQLGRMQVCTSHQTDNHTSTPPLSFLQAGCPSCRPNNSVKALKATM